MCQIRCNWARVGGLSGVFIPPKMSIGGTNNPSWYATNRIVEAINRMPRIDPTIANLVFILRDVLLQTFLHYRVNCFSLQRPAVFLPDVLLSTQVATDVLGFAACIPPIDNSASHWENDRFALSLCFCCGGNEQW